LRQEEMPVVLGTLRTYLRQELLISAANFGNQLTNFGIYGYGPNHWVSEIFDKILPGQRSHYLQSRQASGKLPFDFCSNVQYWTVLASSMLVLILAPVIWRRRSRPLRGLVAIVAFMVTANAFVTAVLSSVEDRYQARVIWLVPLVAGVFIIGWLDRRALVQRGSIPPTCFQSVTALFEEGLTTNDPRKGHQ
jgi:hypothetical protein